MIIEYRNEGTLLPTILRHHYDNSNWLAGDNFDEFEAEAQRAGPCTVFKFNEGTSSLFMIHCHASEAIFVVSRTGIDGRNRSTSMLTINLGNGMPRYMAFEQLTQYLKNSGWLSMNPRLYNSMPFVLIANSMQMDYGSHVEQIDKEDFDQSVYFGSKKPTLSKRFERWWEIAKLYSPTHS